MCVFENDKSCRLDALLCLDKTGNDVFQNKFLEFKIIQNEKYMKYMLEITISTGN